MPLRAAVLTLPLPSPSPSPSPSLAEQLVAVADQHGGRVVSVLEGGYSLSAPSPTSDGKRPARAAGGGKQKAGAGLAGGKTGTGTGAGAGAAGGACAGAGAGAGADPSTQFAQQPGDGGLVKGVLGHVAALAGRASWC